MSVQDLGLKVFGVCVCVWLKLFLIMLCLGVQGSGLTVFGIIWRLGVQGSCLFAFEVIACLDI